MHRELRIQPVSDTTRLVLPEKRSIRLKFPPRIRLGDSGIIQLNLQVEMSGSLTPAAANVGNAATGESANIYDTSKVIVEARLELPGVIVRPSELISAPIAQGQPAVFYWTLQPGAVGNFGGTIWLYIRTVNNLTGRESRETISAQVIEIESARFLGLRANQARILGMGGSVLGLILSLPIFESRILSFMRKKTKNVK